MKESQVAGVLTPVLAQFGLELEAVEIIPAGKRRLVRVVVDGDGPQGAGPLLDDIAEASKAASAALDECGCDRPRVVHARSDFQRGEPTSRATSTLAAEHRTPGRGAIV